jgi:glutamate/tyrosine decarboxylase-like PLP-dependent enzyme
MLSEQTLPSVLGYFAGMLFNPNNVTAEAAPITVELELEVGRMVAGMLGFNPKRAWAHITSGGTVANLEALWVARSVQFAPLMVQEYCAEHNLPFRIQQPSGQAPIGSCQRRSCWRCAPTRRSSCGASWRAICTRSWRQPLGDSAALDQRPPAAKASSIASHAGLPAVLGRVGLRPLIFASAAAHYSMAKTANILGYGEAAVRSVPVTPRFQMDMDALRAMLDGQASRTSMWPRWSASSARPRRARSIRSTRFTSARRARAQRTKRSFWLHVDAAWGGYIRSLFCGLDLPQLPARQPAGSDLRPVCAGAAHGGKGHAGGGNETQGAQDGEVRWAERSVYAAFLAMADADSTTVDPHKLGFTPYPAGIVAFRNGLVTEHIIERAQYISDEAGGIKAIDQPLRIDAVGPYILEGSKPGAAALSCWLAHTTIPLTATGTARSCARRCSAPRSCSSTWPITATCLTSCTPR